MQQAITSTLLKAASPTNGEKPTTTDIKPPKQKPRESKRWLTKTFEITDEPIPEHLLPPNYACVPRLLHGLEGILEKKGVNSKDNYKSGIWSQHILSPGKVKFSNFAKFSLPSQDDVLLDVGMKMNAKVITSTSSFTPLLAKLYYLLIHSISPNITYNEDEPLSISFPELFRSKYFPIGCKFKKISKSSPSSLSSPSSSSKVNSADRAAVYTMDSIQIQQAGSNVLSFLGKSIEKMLTTHEDEFLLKFGHTSTHSEIDPEYYHYLKKGILVCRSQLDCYGEVGTFDIKSRAIKAVRSDLERYQVFYGFSPPTPGYRPPLFTHDVSLLKEEFKMMSWGALIKHNNQIRLGKMKGIFVAYHNTREFLGFEYIPKEELDKILFDGSVKGDKFYELLLKVAEICLRVCFNRTSSDDFSVMFYALGNRFDFIIREPKPNSPPPSPPSSSLSTQNEGNDVEGESALQALRQLLSSTAKENQVLDATYYCYSIRMEVYKNKERIVMPQFNCSDSDQIEAKVILNDESELFSQYNLARRFAVVSKELH